MSTYENGRRPSKSSQKGIAEQKKLCGPNECAGASIVGGKAWRTSRSQISCANTRTCWRFKARGGSAFWRTETPRGPSKASLNRSLNSSPKAKTSRNYGE